MQVDLLITQLAILFLPGIIWARLDSRYALKVKPSDAEFIIRAFMFGLVSYAITFVVYTILGLPFAIVDLSEAATTTVFTRAIAIEILSAAGIGFILAIIWIYAATYKWLTRCLQRIHATKMYGDEDVWDFTFNSRSPAVEYIHYRDIENGLVYAGWVNTFSESGKIRELVLRNVQVFNENREMLYETPLLYLARKPEGVHIEFPYRQSGM